MNVTALPAETLTDEVDAEPIKTKVFPTETIGTLVSDPVVILDCEEFAAPTTDSGIEDKYITVAPILTVDATDTPDEA